MPSVPGVTSQEDAEPKSPPLSLVAKRLPPGRYTLIITATNAAGARSAPVSLSFTIVR